VVQTERDQQPLNEAVDGRGGARVGDRRPVRERVDAGCIGGQIADSTTPAMPAASAVTIGTERLPEKNARYGGRVVR